MYVYFLFLCNQKLISGTKKMMKLLLGVTFVALCTADDVLNCRRNPLHRGWRISGPDACEVEPHSKPWMVYLGKCTGTLIGQRVVLTALHCIQRSPKNPLRVGQFVSIGSHDNRIREQGRQWRKIKKFIPYFENGSADHTKADYLIIILDKKVDITKTVQVANLPRPGFRCPNNLQVCGWGNDYFDRNRNTDTLYCVRQKCRPVSECPLRDQLPEFKLCASYPGSHPYDWLNSACKGDSGGPLFYTDEKGRATVIGVVSKKGTPGGMGSTCNSPTIYASLSSPRILKWIKDNMLLYI